MENHDIFNALVDSLQERGLTLDKAFELADADHDGLLDPAELDTWIRQTLPSCTAQQRQYFHTMLDLQGDGVIGPAEFVEGVGECRALGSSEEVENLLGELKTALLADNLTLESAALQIGVKSSDLLQCKAVAPLLKKIFPDLTDRELLQMLRKVWSNSGEAAITLLQLRDALGLDTSGEPAVLRDASPAIPEESESEEKLMVWKLHEYEIREETVFIDLATGIAYGVGNQTEYLLPMGEVAGSTVIFNSGARDLFRELDVYLKAKGVKLRRLFQDLEQGRDEIIRSEQLGDLLQMVLPSCTTAEKSFFQAMIDIDGRGSVSYENFFKSIAECKAAGSSLASQKAQGGVEDAMHTLHTLMVESGTSVKGLFDSLDVNGEGKLCFHHLTLLVRTIAPDYENTDLRYCLHRFQAADSDKDGALTLEEVAQCLALCEVEVEPGPPLVSTSKCDAPLKWELQKHIIGGEEYLVDHNDYMVYRMGGILNTPVLHGHLDGPNVISQGNGRRELFESLDIYVKEKQGELQEKFNVFDADKSGSLDSNEMHKMLSALLPGVTPSESTFFAAMADLNGDGEVIFGELLNCIKEAAIIRQPERSTSQVEQLLKDIHDYVKAHNLSLRAIVDMFDFHQEGGVDYRELSLMLSALLPNVPRMDLRRLVRHFQVADVDNDCRISYTEMMRALGFVEVATSGVPDMTAAGIGLVLRTKSSVKDTGERWTLVPRTVDGQELLLDEVSQLLYKLGPKNGHPLLQGRLRQDGHLENITGQDVFIMLDAYVKNSRDKLREAFDNFDGDKDGMLTEEELQKLAKSLKPDCSPAEARYFATMVDIDGDSAVLFDDMVLSMRECKRIADMAQESSAGAELEAAVQVLNEHVRKEMHSVKVAFDHYDADGSGFLEARELARLVHSLMPALTRGQLRSIVQYLHTLDVNNDGRISYPELVKALHFSHVSVSQKNAPLASPRETDSSLSPHGSSQQGSLRNSPRGTGVGGTSKAGSSLQFQDMSSSGATSEASDASPRQESNIERPLWKLMERVVERRKVLVDPTNSNAYERFTEGGPPILRGRMVSGGLKKDLHPPDVFQPLGNAIRERSERLRTLFRKYDLDLSGKLDSSELCALLTSFMPGLSEQETLFCQAILDVDGDGLIDEKEMRKAVELNMDLYVKTEKLLESMAPVMSSLSRAISGGSLKPRAEFEKMDKHSKGTLEFPEAVRLMLKLAPGLKKAQRRVAVAYLYYADFDRKGCYTFMELMQMFGMVNVMVEAAATEKAPLRRRKYFTIKGRPQEDGSEVQWKLVQQTIKGGEYWVDRQTNLVYLPAATGVWPILYGQLSGVDAVDTTYRHRDLFQGLERYLKERKMQLARLFEKFDWDKSGRLDPAELSNFLLELMPAATDVECTYFKIMMNVEGSRKGHSYTDFVQAISECQEAAAAVSLQAQQLTAAMAKLHERIQANNLSVMEVFEEYDGDGDGEQGLDEVNAMIRSLVPAASAQEKRMLLCQIFQWDVDHNGLISYPELMQALRLAVVRIVGAKKLGGTQQGAKVLMDWRLKLVQVSGQAVLLDRQTGLGFRASRHDGYPVLIGSVRSGELFRISAEIELFAQLEPFLSERKV